MKICRNYITELGIISIMGILDLVKQETIELERTSGSRNNEALENTRRTLRQGASIGGENENKIKEEDANKFERSGKTPANVDGTI